MFKYIKDNGCVSTFEPDFLSNDSTIMEEIYQNSLLHYEDLSNNYIMLIKPRYKIPRLTIKTYQ